MVNFMNYLKKLLTLGVIFMSTVSFNPILKPANTEIPSRDEIMRTIDLDILSIIPKGYFYGKDSVSAFLNLLNDYPVEDLRNIVKDFFNLKDKIFKDAFKNQVIRQYVVTAGGPGSGKSTILENYLKENPGFAYIDPDRSCLLHMENTYNKYILSHTPQESYEKWRNASNFIANVLMCYALEEGYNIAHGATMTSPYSVNEFEALKGYKYNRKILHINCPDELRIDSEKTRRESGIFQCSDIDFVNKGEDFFKRLED